MILRVREEPANDRHAFIASGFLSIKQLAWLERGQRPCRLEIGIARAAGLSSSDASGILSKPPSVSVACMQRRLFFENLGAGMAHQDGIEQGRARTREADEEGGRRPVIDP